MAGVAGVSPYDFTMRELRMMATGVWDGWSLIATMLVNVNRDPKKRAIPADSFNPYRPAKKSSRRITAESLHAMKPLLVRQDAD